MSETMPSIRYMPPLEPLGRGVSIRHVLRVWRRHRRLFFICAAVVIAAGGAATLLLKPSYTATATVAIAPQNIDPLAPSGQQQVDQVEDDLPATEAAMMQSRDVAAAVIAQVPPLQQAPGFSLRGKLCHAGLAFLCPKPTPTGPEAARQAAIDAFLKTLSVVPEVHSRVIDVSVTAKTGARAAMLADAVVSNYQRIGLAQQTANIDQDTAWLDARTAQLRQRWLDTVQTADAFSVSHGLTNAGDDGTTSNPLIDSQITNMAASLGTAQSQLAVAQANAEELYDAARHGDASALVAQGEQPILVAAASSLAQLESTRDQLAAEFGPNYPRIKALDQQIAAARGTVNSQTGTALASVGENLVSARAEVQELTTNLNTLRAQAAAQSAPQAQYRSLSEEAVSARTVYENFLEHENDVVDRAALLEPPVVFVSHAGIPLAPTFPNKPKLALGIIVLALMAGLAAIFISDYVSEGFEEADDLRASVQFPLLATLPFIPARRNHSIANHVLDDPFSRTSEAVRGLAAQLSLLGAEGHKPRSVLIVSASASEGKTTLALWLAMTVRQGGKAVLMIDADHRRGALMRGTSETSKPGLTDLLSGRAVPAEVIQTDPATGIDFISAGSAMSRPFGAEEIARLRGMIDAMKRSYGFIVIDGPPLLAMSDGLVHGSVVDQTVFMCRWQQTSRKAVTASLDRLIVYGARVSGIVVSMVDQNSTLAFGGDYSRRETRLISRLYGS